MSALHSLAQRCKRFSPLLALPAALLLTQGEAKALLTYNIYESGGNVVVQASGSLNLTGATQIASQLSCGYNGVIYSPLAAICTGVDSQARPYSISGSSSFTGSAASLFGASSVSGIFTLLYGGPNQLVLDPAYTSNSPIVSSATFNGTTLAALGFTATGLIDTWALNGTSETIQVVIGAPSPAAVPGPLPLLGAGAAFGWARRLRKRTQLL
jgi:hypothetical protein